MLSKFRLREANFNPAGRSRPLISLINVYSVSQETDSDSMVLQKLKITFGSKTITGKTF